MVETIYGRYGGGHCGGYDGSGITIGFSNVFELMVWEVNLFSHMEGERFYGKMRLFVMEKYNEPCLYH